MAEATIQGLAYPLTLLLAIFGTVADATIPAEQAAESQEGRAAVRSQPTFAATSSLVVLNVTVTDGEDPASGLSSRDFEVYEDGVKQQVQFFDAGRVPLDLILLLDTSSSMRDEMPLVQKAARDFMTVLAPGDRGAVVAFTETVRIVQGLTSDHGAISAAIGAVTTHGSTALHMALYVAIDEFGKPVLREGEMRRQAIVVLSDGADTTSLVGLEDVLALTRRTGVNIYPIRLQPKAMPYGEAWSPAVMSLKTLAKETGARAFFPNSIHELKNAYAAVADELRAQYALAYSPLNGRVDGRMRTIMVRLPFHPDLRPRTRTGYAATPARATR